jgi:MoaA/NifB/PqqE/SkfB family radical SAM enzyme
MRLEYGWTCNFRCAYCNQGERVAPPTPLTTGEIQSLIRQVRDLGGRSVVIVGGGEPTIQTGFRDLIEFIAASGMTPVVFTNGTGVDRTTAEVLCATGSSVLLKMDSLDEAIQDELAGVKGAHRTIQKGLAHLTACGLGSDGANEQRLGISFVSTALNLGDLPELWRFCRENSIYPNHEILILRGRGVGNEQRLAISKPQMAQLKTDLLRIDHEYGFDWLPYKPLTGAGCLQYLYSIYLACDGYARICADVDFVRANTRQLSVADILGTEAFQALRRIDERVEGKCRGCEYSQECIGCRCAAYAQAILDGCDPSEAVRCEDPFCWKPS